MTLAKEMKIIYCMECNREMEVGKYTAFAKCEECKPKRKVEVIEWTTNGKVITCRTCGEPIEVKKSVVNANCEICRSVKKKIKVLADSLYYNSSRDSTALGTTLGEVRSTLFEAFKSKWYEAHHHGWLSEASLSRIDHKLPYSVDNIKIEPLEVNLAERRIRDRAKQDRSYVTVKEKRCKQCGQTKSADEFFASKNMKDGLLNECAKCFNVKKRAYFNSAVGRLSQLLTTARKRCRTNQGYINKGIEFRFKGTSGEIARRILVLRPEIGEDIKRLLKEGKTPTIDRIDASKGYSLGNIRIIDHSENSKSISTTKAVRIRFDDGRVIEVGSIHEASRQIGCAYASAHNAVKRGGRMPKFNCTIELIDN